MMKIEKVTLNIGAGSDEKNLIKATKLLQRITGQKPVGRPTSKKIPTWGVRKKMILGQKVTIRGKKALELLEKCFGAVEHTIKKSSISSDGNFSFGIKSYIDLPGYKYDPEIGLMGFDVCVSMRKWGYGINNKKIKPGKVPKRHYLKPEETIKFIEDKFKVKVE